jgi:hypothetical protein
MCSIQNITHRLIKQKQKMHILQMAKSGVIFMTFHRNIGVSIKNSKYSKTTNIQ